METGRHTRCSVHIGQVRLRFGSGAARALPSTRLVLAAQPQTARLETVSTYALLGVPEALSTALVLIWLSLTLAPWFGGSDVGVFKIPKLSRRTTHGLRIAAPIGLIVFIAGFLPVWPVTASEPRALSFSEYLEGFFDSSKNQAIHGRPYPLSELEARGIQELLGGTRWDGGANWGAVTFDESGRNASFTNRPGRSPGRLLVQGAPPGTIPILVGEWQQPDGQAGRVMLVIPATSDGDRLGVRWGPSFATESEWKRVQ